MSNEFINDCLEVLALASVMVLFAGVWMSAV